MMGCCGHFSALLRSKNEWDLLFSRLSPSGPAAVCWGCLLRSSSLCFPMPWSKTPPRLQGQGGWKEDEWWGEQRPQLWGPRPATFTHVILTNNEREPLRGRGWTGTADSAAPHPPTGRSLPSRWRVITYILPKMRICSVCHVYTNSDLQGEYRWQVIRVRLHGAAASFIFNQLHILKP